MPDLRDLRHLFYLAHNFVAQECEEGSARRFILTPRASAGVGGLRTYFWAGFCAHVAPHCPEGLSLRGTCSQLVFSQHDHHHRTVTLLREQLVSLLSFPKASVPKAQGEAARLHTQGSSKPLRPAQSQEGGAESTAALHGGTVRSCRGGRNGWRSSRRQTATPTGLILMLYFAFLF